jgi:ubiquinone/menaquinone biosynthesis C-methylase UbiE/uncharacterized protein YbaR (Trm112 family)
LKEKLLNLLCCPICKNEKLDLNIEEKITGEIKSGTLCCSECSNSYPIVKGIPRFVGKHISSFDDQVKQRFEQQWQTWGSSEIIFGRTKTESIEYFNKYAGEGFQQDQLKNKICVDAGCGHGRFTEIMAEGAASLSIGIDLGEGIEKARLRTKHLENVELVQADLLKLPFKSNIVDYIWSDGVLHHTENTEKGLNEVARLVKENGGLRVWFYPVDSWIWEITQKTIRSVTTKMPSKVLMFFCYLVVPMLAFVKTYSRTQWPKNKWKDCAQVIWDWYSPKYQWHHTPEEVMGWFSKFGFIKLESHDLQTSIAGIKTDSD